MDSHACQHLDTYYLIVNLEHLDSRSTLRHGPLLHAWEIGKSIQVIKYVTRVFTVLFINTAEVFLVIINVRILYYYSTKTHNWVEWTAASVSFSQTKVNDINLNDRP